MTPKEQGRKTLIRIFGFATLFVSLFTLMTIIGIDLILVTFNT